MLLRAKSAAKWNDLLKYSPIGNRSIWRRSLYIFNGRGLTSSSHRCSVSRGHTLTFDKSNGGTRPFHLFKPFSNCIFAVDWISEIDEKKIEINKTENIENKMILIKYNFFFDFIPHCIIARSRISELNTNLIKASLSCIQISFYSNLMWII